jgi:hypothetical protein
MQLHNSLPVPTDLLQIYVYNNFFFEKFYNNFSYFVTET